MKQGKVYCISGIDTGIGKTIVTGLLARTLMGQGKKVITQKLVQTGCTGVSEDILQHRQIMGYTTLLTEDIEGLTCPYVFPVPCSPHLAARLADSKIDCDHLRAATSTLRSRFDIVLLEGAGGLFVPLYEDYILIDYLSGEGWPIILVSSSRLGSINHTLASLEALYHRGMDLSGVVYNRFGETDTHIAADSMTVITRYVKKYGFRCPVVEMRDIDTYDTGVAMTDFSVFFGEV